MVEVGSMSIAGGIDTAMLDRGFDRVKGGLESVKGHAKGMTADLSRMNVAAAGVAKRMFLLGTVGAGAMLALASKAPAVAPALAKIKVTMDRLARSLGRALQPAFEAAAGALATFTNWIEAHEGTIGKLATAFMNVATWVGTAFSDLANDLMPILTKIGTWADDHQDLFAGIFDLSIDKIVLGTIIAVAGASSGRWGIAAAGVAMAGYGSYLGTQEVLEKAGVEKGFMRNEENLFGVGWSWGEQLGQMLGFKGPENYQTIADYINEQNRSGNNKMITIVLSDYAEE